MCLCLFLVCPPVFVRLTRLFDDVRLFMCTLLSFSVLVSYAVCLSAFFVPLFVYAFVNMTLCVYAFFVPL